MQEENAVRRCSAQICDDIAALPPQNTSTKDVSAQMRSVSRPRRALNTKIPMLE